MSNPTRYDVELKGCTPEPLMAYLKALGILRLVSEQKDSGARGWWKNDVFWLRSTLDQDALVKFFLEEYAPTPIVVPWSGGDFFAVNWEPSKTVFKKTPSSARVIESITLTTSARIEGYRKTLLACKTALSGCGMDTAYTTNHKQLEDRKIAFGKRKWEFIQLLRGDCAMPAVVEWIDTAAVIGVEKFAPLLGSGGGSDGNTHFSDNFMQNLWEMLPDFDDQRAPLKGKAPPCVATNSRIALRDMLFREASTQRVANRTSSLFDSGAVGGANATQGLERESLTNPWDFILGLEGTLLFAGAPAKRFCNDQRMASFPFQIAASPSKRDSLIEKERVGREIWLPLWQRPSSNQEVRHTMQDGRSDLGRRTSKSGIDIAQSIATLGVDRGISSFNRYAIVKGRVGGDNYNTAAALGRFYVLERREVDLLRELDPWLDRFRRSCGKKGAPSRFGPVLHAIDSSIFDFCRYGTASQFQRILAALGAVEQELGTAERFCTEHKIKPIAGLSSAWLVAADDHSAEFRLALALASVHDANMKIGPLRANLEPVDWLKGKCGAWAEKDRSLVWNAADLSTNLAAVLQRRMMDADRRGCDELPIASHANASLGVVSSFLAGDVDEQLVERLLWGSMLMKHEHDDKRALDKWKTSSGDATQISASLPREYALLKLLFLPRALTADRSQDKIHFRLARLGETGLRIRTEPRILPLLRAGRIGEACTIAAQRLRVSGLPTIPGPLSTGVMRDRDWTDQSIDQRRGERLAAALLIPISSRSVHTLVQLVCRDQSEAADALFTTNSKGDSL